MVASGLNFLPPAAKAIASAPSAPTSTSTSNAASPSSDHSFARLVEQSSNDSRATARDSVQDRQDTRDATKSTPAATVDTTSTADATPPTPAQLDQPVTPTQAADLLNHFDSLSASLTSAGVDSAGLQDLKNQLQQIAAGETPQSLGDLLAALPVTDTEPTAAALDLSSLFMAPPTPVTRDDNGAAATNQGAEAALADETAPDTADTAETTASAAPVLPVTTAPLAPPQAPTAIRVFHVLNAALEQSSAPVVAIRTSDGSRLAEMKFAALADHARVTMPGDGYGDAINTIVTREPIAGYTPKEIKKYNAGDPIIHLYFSADAKFVPVRATVSLPIGELSVSLEEMKTPQ